MVRIDSYFTLPTDLASAMRSWPEFVSGDGYRVELADGGAHVNVSLVPAVADDCQHVIVQGDSADRLFQAVLGHVTYQMAAHSDNLTICWWREHEA